MRAVTTLMDRIPSRNLDREVVHTSYVAMVT